MTKRIIAGIAIALGTAFGIGAAGAAGSGSAVTTQYVAPVDAGMAALAPTGVYAGTVTSSGGFTGDVAEGSASAPITIIEYASLSCPSCAKFHAGTYPALKSQYIDTGKVRFIMRDFPLNESAFAATIMARCGGSQNYLNFVHQYLSTQDQWAFGDDWLQRIETIGRQRGLDPQRIDACLKDGALFQSINERRKAGAAVFGVGGTPTLVINGQRYDGRGDFGSVSQFIDSML